MAYDPGGVGDRRRRPAEVTAKEEREENGHKKGGVTTPAFCPSGQFT